jgi:RNA polymerase sigma-70 factor (sigma-E family)
VRELIGEPRHQDQLARWRCDSEFPAKPRHGVPGGQPFDRSRYLNQWVREGACLAASQEEFDGFVRAASPALLRAAWLLAGDWPAAEDLVQTAFEKTWPRWDRLVDDRHRLAYLHRVLTNAFLRGKRRRWLGEVATGDLPHRAASDGSEDLVLRASVVAAVRELPPRQRTVIALRYLADLTEAQTAAAMHCSTGTVKSYSARALAALRADPVMAGLFAEETKS